MRIIKFTALWCADCIVMRPYWSEVAAKYPGVEVLEFDFDDQPEMAEKHGVKKVPHTIFLSDSGDELHRHEGMQDKEDLIDLIEKHLNN